MRTIEIGTDVFSSIWAHRLPGEESEDEILRRLLLRNQSENRKEEADTMSLISARSLWRDDVKVALSQLGGKAPLAVIYKKVREIRLREGRKIPKSIDAIIRRELEYNSSDSESYQRRFDWFTSVEGIGSGVWGLRSVQF